jgi:beta-glucanase (GH16 family)
VVTSSSGTVSATSRTSTAVGGAGSVVHVASQLRSSGVQGAVSMTLEEVASDGSTVQRFAGTPSSTSDWAWAGAKVTTKRAGSRVRVVYRAESAAPGAVLDFRSSDVTVDPADPGPTPTPTTPTPTTPTPTPTTPPPADGDATRTCDDLNDPARRTLAWAEEFNGSSLDTSRWNVRDKTSLSFDAAYLTKDAVKVGNGVMTIQGRRRSSPATVSSGMRERWYDTGYIDTIGKASQKYGRWEMRAKLPTAHSMTRGVWPAFWLRGDKTAGEIDIMEAYGGESIQRWNPAGSYTTTLWEDTNLGKQKGEWYAWAHKDWATRSPSASVYSEFHTYGFNWTPDCMQFTLDGQVLSTIRTADVPWTRTAFDSPFNIRLNMQVGSSYWGMPDTAHTKNAFDYVVDSVKVYRMNP